MAGHRIVVPIAMLKAGADANSNRIIGNLHTFNHTTKKTIMDGNRVEQRHHDISHISKAKSTAQLINENPHFKSYK
jgi:hypothetical protein